MKSPSSKLTARLGIRYPILQAPIGSMGGVDLAAAVSNAGGLGSLALTWTPPEAARQIVLSLRARTPHPFFVNFVLSFPPLALEAALEAGAPAVTFSWGDAGSLIDKVHRAGSLVGVQVAAVEEAMSAANAGADFIICQGVEAGGHVQSTMALAPLLSGAVKACGVPVVAAGGLADGEDIRWALDSGADAVMLGTRFVATIESRAHALYKQAIVDAKREDAVLTLCFDGGWAGAAHRVLRNPTLMAWEAAGCPPAGRRPGEGELIAKSPSGKAVVRYDDTPPESGMVGDVEACALYAGSGCGKVRDIPTAAALLSRLWAEALAADGKKDDVA